MDKRLKQSRRELEQWCRDHEKRREVTRRLLLAQANEHAALPDMSVNMFETRPAGQWICDLAEDRSAALFGDLWLEGELSILFADTGVGKSILAVQIAEAIAAGKDAFALGESSTDLPLPNGTSPQPVLYLDFELSGRQFTDRYTGDGAPTNSRRTSSGPRSCGMTNRRSDTPTPRNLWRRRS
jgi:RecA-family ATPase